VHDVSSTSSLHDLRSVMVSIVARGSSPWMPSSRAAAARRLSSKTPPPRPRPQQQAVLGKNSLGLGPNVTGLLLGGLFFGVYFGSSWFTRRWIINNSDNELQPPKNFKDIRIVKSEPQR
jgi:hypothetical protein